MAAIWKRSKEQAQDESGAYRYAHSILPQRPQGEQTADVRIRRAHHERRSARGTGDSRTNRTGQWVKFVISPLTSLLCRGTSTRRPSTASETVPKRPLALESGESGQKAQLPKKRYRGVSSPRNDTEASRSWIFAKKERSIQKINSNPSEIWALIWPHGSA
jgi:hypothetical protein